MRICTQPLPGEELDHHAHRHLCGRIDELVEEVSYLRSRLDEAEHEIHELRGDNTP
jgi:hypothetical protein